MVSSTNAAYNLTIHTAASPPYTLRVMTVVAAIFVPAVLVYQAWSYHIFRKRLSVPRVGGEAAGTTTAEPANVESP
jgi:cytochrome d ubiquinol oxidase subunit II